MTFQRYISKNDLYDTVDKKIRSLGITYNNYPINSISLAKGIKDNIIIEYHKFKSFSICGMLYKGDNISTIYLNSLRSGKGHNFDCMHELMHYWFHDSQDIICCDKSISQHKGREWQANEAAAQALMPVELFLQKYHEYSGNISKLSDFFNVGETSIEYRIKNLKNEISKYPIKMYCSNCHNFIIPDTKYCAICGCYSFIKGDKYMHYKDGYELNENGRVLICPVCKNEDINYKGNYCNVCGTYLVNECTNDFDCGCICESSARYCKKCGNETTFLQNKLLKPWNKLFIWSKEVFTLESFSLWPKILEDLKKDGRMMLCTYLTNTFTYQLDDLLYVGYLDEYKAMMNSIKKPELIDVLKATIKKHIDISDIKFVDEDWMSNHDIDTEALRDSLKFKTKKVSVLI